MSDAKEAWNKMGVLICCVLHLPLVVSLSHVVMHGHVLLETFLL